MAVKVKAEMASYPRAMQAKVSLYNGGIPGRESKFYYTSNHTYLNSMGQRSRTFTDGRAPIVGEVNVSSVHGHGQFAPDQLQYLGPPWPGDLADELLDSATSSLFQRVQKARDTNFNGAVFLGEMTSTWKMFVGTARRVVFAYRAARRGNLNAARSALGVPKGKTSKGVANNWLELQYGWLPLLGDIDSAARKLADRIRTRPVVFKAEGSSSVSRTTVRPIYDFVDSYRTSPGSQVTAENFGARIGVSYTVSDTHVALASELGFTNPYLLAWELLPLSFVLDWIISVGDWLQSISTFHGLSFRDGYSTVKGDVVLVTVVPGFSETGYKWIGVGYDDSGNSIRQRVPDYYHHETPSTIRSSASGFRRTPMTEFPSAPLPRIDPKGSWKKAMTSWALLRQRMR